MKKITIHEFKKNLSKYENETVLKDYTPSVETDDSRVVTFIISTEDVDRSDDVIDQGGWNLKNYMKNPVVFFNHKTDELPIGKCINIEVVDKQLRASVEFVPADVPVIGEKAEAVYQMLKSGFLSATSVGFKPIEYEITDDQTRGAGTFGAGIDFIQCELTEFSIVGVPCNPNALVDELLSVDKKSLSDSYQTALMNGLLSVNEVRALEGMEPIEAPKASIIDAGKYKRIAAYYAAKYN